jgi:predicted SAM-dependent methyltransferase
MKINLASGERPFSNPWVNIDIKDQGYKIDIIADALDLNMIKDETVDVIVAHHLLEHIPLHHVEVAIAEWRRVLKKGGILFISVPNLKEINKAWIEGRIDTFIHNVNTYGAFKDSHHDLHKWGYDQRELEDRVSGWDGNNKKFDWSEIRAYNPNNPLYQGANIATDWWILEREFVK